MTNTTLHTSERVFWLLTFFGAIIGTLYLTQVQVMRFIKSPTVISVDRNYRDWVGYMPAITLCYYDRIDSYKANEYILANWNVSIVDEDYFYYMDFLYAVVNASASNYANLAKFAEDERFDNVDLYDLVKTVDKPFEQIINTFEGNFEVSVRSVMTERGSCYVVNSPIGDVLLERFKYSSSTFDDLKQPLKCHFGKQQCFIKIDLLESTGSIDVHSPFEVSSTELSAIHLHKSDEIIASYKVLETVASSNLPDLNPDQRKCVYNHEETAGLRIYSKTLCLAKCRATMAIEMCNCVPFFYTFVDGPKCTPSGFECLLDFKWPVWALHICKCPNTCFEMQFTVQTVKKSSWGGNRLDDAAKSDVVAASFRWDLIPPKVRMRRDVVFSFEDLLVSFGGILALCLGFSLVALFNLFYVVLKHNLEDIYLLFKYIINKIKDRFIIRTANSNKLQFKTIKNLEILKNLNRKRAQLIKMHAKTSEDLTDVEKNYCLALHQDEELNKSDDLSPPFEYVN